MIYEITKECTSENIIYSKIDNEHVKKCHYNKNGQKIKEKKINVKNVHHNRKSHRNVQDFFEDMIWNRGYREIK